jgi:hypothetical protein
MADRLLLEDGTSLLLLEDNASAVLLEDGIGLSLRLLIIDTQPSSEASTFTPFAQQPAIQLADINNDPVAEADVVVTASLGSGTGVLNGTLSATTDGDGLATFTNLSITGLGAFTIDFDSYDKAGTTSNTVTVGRYAYQNSEINLKIV